MRKPEQRLYDNMKAHKPPRVWLRRIENEVGTGEADVWVGTNRHQTWVELKAAILPKRSTTRLMGDDGLRVSQINWHLKMASLELPTWVLIRDNSQQLYLLRGRHADIINEMTASELEEMSVAEDFEAIYAAILSEETYVN